MKLGCNFITVPDYNLYTIAPTANCLSEWSTKSTSQQPFFDLTFTIVAFDNEGQSDFYNYPVQVGRYRSISLQPGELDDKVNVQNFMKMKIIVINMRDKVLEQKLVIAKPGCGDGSYDSSLTTEACDDGNFINGDGCDQNC